MRDRARDHVVRVVEVAVTVLPASGSGEDRAVAVPTGCGYFVAVADGVGGTGNGAAAERLVTALTKLHQENGISFL